MPRLEEQSALWARHAIAEKATELRKAAEAARRRGNAHLPIRQATNVVAEAYDRAVTVLDRAIKEIES